MSSRRALCTAAIQILEQRTPGCLAAPAQLQPVSTCIEDDDLDAAGVTGEELETMMAGPDRDRVRNWLASLSTVTRVIFVLRAVAGFSSPETAAMLAANGGRGCSRMDRGSGARSFPARAVLPGFAADSRNDRAITDLLHDAIFAGWVE